MPKAILTEQGGKGGGEGFTLIKIEITNQPSKTSYLAGDAFQTAGMEVTASYGINGVVVATAPVTSYTCNPTTLRDGDTKVVVTYSELGVTRTAEVKVTVTHKLTSITCTDPTKKTYEYGDTLQTGGCVVTAHYSDNKTTTVTGQFSPTNLTTIGTQKITVTYTENQVTQTTSFNVTIERKRVAKPTWKGTLTYNGAVQYCTNASLWNNYNATYMTMAGVTSGTDAKDYGATFTPQANYQWADSTTTQITVNWTIARQAIATQPTWKANITYDGTAKTVTATTYWNNYDTTKMTIGGTTTGTNANSYPATFTPTSNYCWTDGSTTAITVNWTISKAAGSLTPTTQTINLSASALTGTVTYDKHGSTGALSNSTLAGTTITWAGNAVTVKGDGSTAIAGKTITITMAADTNHTQATATITVNATYWSWGAGTGEAADATWFTGLKNYLASHTGASIKTSSNGNIIGTTKTVTLTSPVLGTTAHRIRVIDVDRDGTNTVTFQTENMLTDYLNNQYGSSAGFGSNAKWEGSNAKLACQAYYAAFPGKSTIKTVTKQTNSEYDKASLVESNETVFLPSIFEMGLGSYTYAPKAAEYTKGVSTAYAYYDSDAKRVKKKGDSGNADWYWTRSRSSYSSDYVCNVSNNGTANTYYYYYTTVGLAPAFVIGN